MKSTTSPWITAIALASILAGMVVWNYSSKRAEATFLSNMTSEATILLELTNSYVSTYGRLRAESVTSDLPVPASYRAEALAHFDKGHHSADQVKTSMVGLPGREIATAATDQQMKRQLLQMETSQALAASTEVVLQEGLRIHRTLFPSIASNSGCVDCHNQLQASAGAVPWSKGDLMGAYVVDRFVDKQLAAISQLSVILGVLSALFTAAALLVVLYAKNQSRMAQRMSELASSDPLTGCINRRAMYESVRSMGDNVSGALLMLDLDKFKQINDTHGHATGDLILVDFATRIRRALRANDWVARIGGEEFVIWLPETSLDDAQTIGERIRLQTEAASIKASDMTINYTVSIGLQKITNNHPSQFEHWLSAADSLLYRAKLEGRNRLVIGHAVPASFAA